MGDVRGVRREASNTRHTKDRRDPRAERGRRRNSLGDVAPGLATYVLETIYGQIYQSPILDSRTRQIVTVASLSTLGTAGLQLWNHIGGALHCLVTRDELIEI